MPLGRTRSLRARDSSGAGIGKPGRMSTLREEHMHTITILGGRGKNGQEEPVRRLDLSMGSVVSVVGPTGSGKTTLINDIELFADGDTPTGRRILIDGRTPPAAYRDDPSRNPIARITQHTNFLSDLRVEEFLRVHASIRCQERSGADALVRKAIEFANQLTGEPINLASTMTELSGGQTRAMLIADATVICNTPIVLLDEVENAGINRAKALELLRKHRKIFIFVTHDPRIALLSDFRIVLQGGCMTKVLRTNEEERRCALTVSRWDDLYSALRDKIRFGWQLSLSDVGGLG